MNDIKKLSEATNIKGRSVIITGSTSGIGLGIARAFAAEGAQIMINGFGDHDEIEKIRQELSERSGAEAHYCGADMSKPSEIADMMTEAENTFGSVDILVNNVGIQFVSAIDEFPDDKWEAIIAINLSSAFYTTKAALPGMKSRGWGRIINIASAHGLVASPFKAAYVAAKHGVVGLTKTTALEIAEQDITVNAICPGYVRTPLVEGQIVEQAKVHGMPRDQVIRDVILAAQPNKRFTEVEEIGGLAVFLCSDFARSMTGRAISVDGGWTAR